MLLIARSVLQVVYIARDPRDVAISFFHHNKLMRIIYQNADFKTYWNYFIKNEGKIAFDIN